MRTAQSCWRLIAASAFAVQLAFGGVCLDRTAGERPKHEWRVLAGYAPSSPVWIGTARDYRMMMGDLSYSYGCWNWKNVALSYTGGIMPVLLIHEPDRELNGVPGGVVSETPSLMFRAVIPGQTIYGFAVMPTGVTMKFAPDRPLHPIAEWNGGVVASTRPVPYNLPDATGLNFLFNFGGGLRWMLTQRQAVTFGYRFVHISNAGTTRFNPGLDGNLFYASYSFLH